MANFIFFNKKIVPENEAVIPVTTHALHYGTGVFEGLRAYFNEKENALYIFRLADHYKRMQQNVGLLYMNLPLSVEELSKVTVELLQKNFVPSDIYIRPLAFKSSQTINLNLRDLEDNFIIYTVPLGRYINTEGVKTIFSSWTRISDTMIPPRGKITGSYVNACLAKTEAAAGGFDEALFLDMHGHVVEGSAENIFLIKNGKVFTPPVSDDILVGITRDTIIELLQKELKMEVVERSIGHSEVYQADEVFLVGTGAEVSPVIEVDKRKIGTGEAGEITQKLKELYFSIVHGQNSKYSHYLTKVSPA